MKIKQKYIILTTVVIAIVIAIVLLEKGGPTSATEIQNFSANSTKEQLYSRAVELTGGTGYINTDNITLASLIGKKVILIDFWTYSCINCIRTTPYLNEWYSKYKDNGLEIIGVHTPEFSFEQDYSNVAEGVKQLNISYPVVLDSNRAIWNAYQNEYWPAEYLIDIDGYVVDKHFGEGDYNTTEAEIQKLLAERAVKLNISLSMNSTVNTPSNAISIDFNQVRSPETYFGAARNEYLANGVSGMTGIQNLSLPNQLQYNALYLSGVWNFSNEYASPLSADASIVYGYSAKNVYAVLNASKEAQLHLFVDGIDNGNVSVGNYDIYPIVSEGAYGAHILQITNISKGTQFYTFTFG